MCIFRLLTLLDRFITGYKPDHGKIVRKYLLSDYEEYDENMKTVPEDSIYVEEWKKGTSIRRRILYEGEPITEFAGNPFTPVKNPWNWIGDASTDVDITLAIDRYLMVGNRIQLDLLFRFLRVHDEINIVYSDLTSGQDVVFPNEGVRIVAHEPV